MCCWSFGSSLRCCCTSPGLSDARLPAPGGTLGWAKMWKKWEKNWEKMEKMGKKWEKMEKLGQDGKDWILNSKILRWTGTAEKIRKTCEAIGYTLIYMWWDLLNIWETSWETWEKNVGKYGYSLPKLKSYRIPCFYRLSWWSNIMAGYSRNWLENFSTEFRRDVTNKDADILWIYDISYMIYDIWYMIYIYIMLYIYYVIYIYIMLYIYYITNNGQQHGQSSDND